MAKKTRYIISQENSDMDVVITNETSSCAVALKCHYEAGESTVRIAKREIGEKAKSLYTLARQNEIPIAKNELLPYRIYNETFIGFTLPRHFFNDESMPRLFPNFDVVILSSYMTRCVVLKYCQDIDAAPRIIAKFEKDSVLPLWDLVRKHRKIVWEDGVLLQKFYDCCNIGEYIPEGTFRDVAAVYAYIIQNTPTTVCSNR